MNAATHPFEQEEVMAYLDGELSANRAAGVAAHLRECSECAALVEHLRQVSNELANWSVEPAPATLAKSLQAVAKDRALSKIKKHEGIAAWLHGKFAPLRHRWALGVASVAAVGLLLVFITQRTTRDRDLALNKEYLSGRSQLAESFARKDAADISSSLETNALPAPSAPPVPGASSPSGSVFPQSAPGLAEPMIARTAAISVIVKDFAPVEANVKAIALRHNGYIASLNSTSPQDAARTLTATLEIPSVQLESAIAELKQLGRVEQESQSGEEVTKEFTDRAARLKNARATEQRLLDILRERTGKLSDILAAEQEIARVRGDIEQMEADQRALQTRVDFATVQLSVQEEYKASLQGAPRSTATRLHNAAVDGYRAAIESVIDIGVWALQSLPALLLWGLAFFFPARWFWKRRRRTAASQS